jgi:hypothetical protein
MRRIAISGLLGCLAISLIVFHRLFDVQHLLSAASTLAMLRLATDGSHEAQAGDHDQPHPCKPVLSGSPESPETRPAVSRLLASVSQNR